MKIVSSQEMRTLDEQATRLFSIPSILLMENAARGLVDQIESLLMPIKGKRFVIIAGGGNNGGDGLAAARHLAMRGGVVSIYLFCSQALVKGDAAVSLEIWLGMGGALREEGAFTLEALIADLKQSDLTIDAFLGTGLSHAISGRHQKWIGLVNTHSNKIVSVDIPSGISADTGEALGIAVSADLSCAMALPKRGHFLRDGLRCSGTLSVVDIGFPQSLVDSADTKVALMTPDVIRGLIPKREKGVHKGTMGHVLVVAGSAGKRGAAEMASMAAMRSGAGLVTTALPKSVENNRPFPMMEIMTQALPDSKHGTLSLSAEKQILRILERKDAVAMGPGLSQDPDTQQVILNLIPHVTVPMVLDADALNAVAVDLSILKQKKGPLVLTPHPGEMGRLIGKSSADVEQDRIEIATSFAVLWGVTLVLKGSHTVIASPEGEVWINDTGNPGMATAGIGDALTGMIAGWLAQGLNPLSAAMVGVYLHGLSGDIAAETKGYAGLLTSDLIESIPEAIMKWKD